MSNQKNVNELYVLRSGLNSLSVLMEKTIPFENLTPEQDADEQAVADKDQYYSITDPDDIDYDAEWAFINALKAKYSVLPDVEHKRKARNK
ncbi:hypothetical protein LU196_14025 [Pantoea sp. Mb-10]|uniref:hypothetical protein n=1 Tax=unclassified Pantoea TaxID=2630326 RepID=UPI001E2A929D|nr:MULTISPECIES: hypothetical protein [unclassified Pantoea]MCE0491161.1 hypothetical protein [Pantoea sp. Mb-10]MCE0502650.1 hypothetical protein [Pantoea sp. Pb-8]